MTNPYQRYAQIYDTTGQHRFGAALAQVSLEWLADNEVLPRTAIDLATGTGAAANELAAAGIEVTGIDRSREMIREARRKYPTGIAWETGSMERFTTERKVDLVTCFFDSLNYLLEPESLAECFASVMSALDPSGWFVFDVNTLGRFEADWSGTTQVAFESDDLLCLFRSSYDRETRISPLLLTVFERESGGSWCRWDEEHIERGYPLADLVSLLAAAGFEIIAIEAFNETTMTLAGPASDASERAIFFARVAAPAAKIHP